MLQSLLFLNALCFGVGMPLVCQENTQQIQEKVEFKQDNRKLVSYNDETYTITLTADELNNYTWNNLSNLFDDNDSLNFNSTSFYCVNDDESYHFEEFVWNELDGYYCQYQFDNYARVEFMRSNEFDDRINAFVLYNPTGEELLTFDSDFNWILTGTIYSDIKQAIELDIQANSYSQPHLQPVLTELVSLLTAGITALASGIGQGVSTLVSDIFINNGALSTFGAVICIFGGIALAIGLSRWVMNFLTSLGAKK